MGAWTLVWSALAIALAGPARADEFSVLSYNTHGLAAWIAGDDPERRLPVIGERSNDYDVVLIQEDFAHHPRLRAGARHPVVRRGNPSRKAWCPICSGSGLTFLSRWKALEALVNGAYAGCSGWLGGANDCLADKGFQIARMRLPGGARVVFANTHLDAGIDASDLAARRRQLDELRRAIDREVDGEALIVGGDFNLNADDEADTALLVQFMRRLGLRDSGARPRRGSSWLVLDYLFYRGGEEADLAVLEAGEDVRFVHEGRPLSDHPAIFARFAVEAPTSSSTRLRPRE